MTLIKVIAIGAVEILAFALISIVFLVLLAFYGLKYILVGMAKENNEPNC